MNMKTKSIILKALLMMSLIWLLAACSGESSSGESNNESSNENSNSESNTKEQVDLVFTTTTGDNVVRFENEIKAFEEKFPNVKVELRHYDDDWYNQNAVRLFNSKDKPDVAWFWGTGFYTDIVESGALLPLDDVYESEGLYDVLDEQSINHYTSPDGNKYAVPESVVLNPILFYNKKAFREAGSEYI
jgi:multiple sugar transport system substrate-binding protein